MKFAKWATTKEMQDVLTENKLNAKEFKNGIPIIYDKGSVYVNSKDGHTLLVSAMGSGKTQSIVLPFIRTTIKSHESMVVIDKKGEMLEKNIKSLKEEGYKTYVFNFERPKLGTCFNPLYLPYEFYKKDDFDTVYKLLDKIGFYLFSDNNESDPYWTKTTIDFFEGLVLHLFKNASIDEINLNSIYLMANSLNDNKKSLDLMNSLDKTDPIYILLAGTLNAPVETKNSIISVFNYKMKPIVCRVGLSKLLSKSDYTFEDIFKNKFAIFIVETDSLSSNSLVALLLDQLYDVKKYLDSKDMVNYILDDFDELSPIYEFPKVLNYSRSIGIRFLCSIKSFTDLKQKYNDINIIRLCFSNLIYLRSNDLYTMDEISKLCGEKEKHERLIEVEELKTMKLFEVIVLLERKPPYKTRLIPDYKLNSNIESEKINFKEKELPEVKTYNF